MEIQEELNHVNRLTSAPIGQTVVRAMRAWSVCRVVAVVNAWRVKRILDRAAGAVSNIKPAQAGNGMNGPSVLWGVRQAPSVFVATAASKGATKDVNGQRVLTRALVLGARWNRVENVGSANVETTVSG